MQSQIDQFLYFQNKLRQSNENNFEEIAWEIFHFQSKHNEVYKSYLKHLRFDESQVKSINHVPFLPIQFFKTHKVKTGSWPTQRVYQSSGTTQSIRSSHHLWDEAFYLEHSKRIFESQFEPLTNFQIIALLPSYDTSASSLVAMTRYFISQSETEGSGFYLNNYEHLIQNIQQSKKKCLLLGVSHALLDLVERKPPHLNNLMVMETGGMKGRREEVTREELHQKLKIGLGVENVYSEYGMTELLSQAYSKSNGIFQCPSTMRIVTKEIADPLAPTKSTGIINIIDLANFHSCSFIETQDLGRVTEEGFEVLGRVDNSEARGCNLLLA